MKINNAFKLIVAIAVCESAGIIGSIFTAPAIGGWYANLSKPSFSPPSWIFAPIWTVLFALMGVALFFVWLSYNKASQKKDKIKAKSAIIIFFVQLIVNVLWSILFFGLQNPGAAFAEIIILWFEIVITIYAFAKVSQTAAWLLVPYLLWVSFAAYLNYSIWQLIAK